MTTWTETSKSSAPTYTEQTKSDPGLSEYTLAIGSSYLLEIGSNFNLIIQSAVSGTVWTQVSKS